MRLAFAILVALHGAIHFMGFAKAFGLADLPQLTQPISRPFGLGWLLAALLSLVAAGAVLAWPGRWWIPASAAVVVSQAVIVSSWRDARWGTLPNLVILVAVVLAALSRDPWGPRAG